MYQEGKIAVSKCNVCGNTFPVFTFFSDTDMLTAGCVALTGSDNKIILTEQFGKETNSEIESRIGAGYKIVQVRYNETPAPKGLSFQEFRKVYKPPVPIYSCVKCGCDSEVVETVTKEQFLTYGKIEVTHGS